MSLPTELARGTVMPIVLSLLGEQRMYGYEIVKTVNARSNGVLEFKEGTLYPLLHKMEGEKLIKASWEDGEHGKPRKYYGLTAKGRRQLKQSRTQWTDLRGAVDTLLLGGAGA